MDYVEIKFNVSIGIIPKDQIDNKTTSFNSLHMA